MLGETPEGMLPQEPAAALASRAVLQPRCGEVRAGLRTGCGFRGNLGDKGVRPTFTLTNKATGCLEWGCRYFYSVFKDDHKV